MLCNGQENVSSATLSSEIRINDIGERSRNHELKYTLGFPGGSDGEASTCNEVDPGSIPGS